MTSNLMFHVKHTAAALLLGVVLVAPTTSHASQSSDCTTVSDAIVAIARARDRGVEKKRVEQLIDQDTSTVANDILHRATDLLYDSPDMSAERARAAFMKGCMRGVKTS